MAPRCVVAGLVLLAASSCSFSTVKGADYRAAAEKLITGTLAEQAGLGAVRPACEKPAGNNTGDTFECTATTKKDEVVRFVATITGLGKVDVESTNLITAANLTQIEEVAVLALEKEVGHTLGVENFDCGDTYTVIDPDEQVLLCALTDPKSGREFDAQVDLPDLTDIRSLTVTVAKKPRA